MAINFYTNRQLSRDLGINLAKWKRWSREFLPPDPLGGMQSGYARQYSMKEAFTVHLGGYLVSGLRFSIPEARKILGDLSAWIENRFFTTLTGLTRGSSILRTAFWRKTVGIQDRAQKRSATWGRSPCLTGKRAFTIGITILNTI